MIEANQAANAWVSWMLAKGYGFRVVTGTGDYLHVLDTGLRIRL